MTSWFTKATMFGGCMLLSFVMFSGGFKIAAGQEKPAETGTVSDAVTATTPPAAALTGCGDSFFDPGGQAGNYTDFQEVTTIICPDVPGEFVEVTFSSFETEACCDRLFVYNDAGTNNLINVYSGNYITQTISATNPTGCLTFYFYPQGTETAAGWEATVNCTTCPKPSDLRVQELSATSATLYWWYNPYAPNYEIEIGLPGFTPGTGEALFTTSTNNFVQQATVNNLEGNTVYEAYIKAGCQNGESEFAGPLTFRTAPGCGDIFTDPGGPDANFHPANTFPILVCPDVPGTFVSVDFQEFDVPDAYGPLYVYDGYNGAYIGAYTNTYAPPSPLTATTATGCLHFVLTTNFVGETGAGWEAPVACVDCPMPNEVRVFNVSSFSATLEWPYSGVADALEWEIGLAGFTPGTGAEVKKGSTNSQTVSVTGLESSTSYDLYVRVVCDANLAGEWRKASFATSPSCGEKFYDSGGPNAGFGPNEVVNTIICPEQPGQFVSVTFTEIDIPDCCNSLVVYSGDFIGSQYLGNVKDFEAPVTFSSFHPSGCMLFQFSSNGDSLGAGWEADVACLTCPTPYGLTTQNVTNSSVNLSWGLLNAATFYHWEVGPAGFTPGSGTATASGNTTVSYADVAGLESGTVYEAYVRSNCGANDTSTYIGPARFFTVPGCGDPFYDSGGPDGDYKQYEDYYTTICPDAPGQFVEVSFSEFDLGLCCGYLEIRDGMYWFDPYLGSFSGTNNPGVVTATNAAGCLNFHFYTNGQPAAGWLAAVSCVTCPAPSGFHVNSLGSETVQLGWNTNSFSNSYYWEVGLPGFTPGIGTAIAAGAVNSNLILVTGLESGTTYHAFLRANCDGSDVSSFTSPLVFTTTPTCGDKFYDNGGPGGDFFNNSYSTTICPDEPQKYVQVNFNEFDLGDCCASLEIRDGESVWSQGMGSWSQQLNPGTWTSTAPSGCLTFIFNSWGNPAPGWDADITCASCPPPYGLWSNYGGGNTLQVAWNHLSPGVSFDYEIGLPGFMPGTGEAVLTGNTFSTFVDLTTLDGGTLYEAYVRTNCGGAAGASTFSGPISFQTLPTCGDVFTDKGGPNGNYDQADYLNVLICPDQPGQYVQLTFTEFELAECCGVMSFYDDYWLGSYNRDSIPPVIVSNASSGCLNVQFAAAGASAPGWVADVACISCPHPNRMTTSASTASTIDISWSYINAANSYEWEAGLPGFTPGTGQAVSSGTSTVNNATATGFESGTTYEFYIRTNCGNGETSTFNGPFKFSTTASCGDNFYDPAGPDSSYVSGGLTITSVICPDEPGEAVEVTFNSFVIHPWEDYLYVYDGNTTSGNLLGTFNGMMGLPGPFTANNPTGCLTFYFQANGGGIWEGWEATVECITCPKVSGLNASGVTSSSATVSWNVLPSATTYEWEAGLPGFLPGTGNALAAGTTSSTTADISGLDSGVDYEFYVRAICGPGDEGGFGNPLKFRTALTCGGTFYDSGGPNGYYNNGEYYMTTICPEVQGQNVKVVFTEFQTEGCCDYMHIYDGNSTSAPYLSTLAGFPAMPQTFTSMHTSGCLTFLFSSDGSSVGDGWVASVECEGCIEPQGFTTEDPAFNGIKLVWQDMPAVSSYNWEVGTPGFVPGIGTAVLVGNTTGNSASITGLLANAPYHAYVRSVCEGNEVGPFAGPLYFSTLLSCGSKSYDTGGPENDYGPNEDYFTLICPEVPGSKITLDFTFFETQACCDFLEILNGKEENSPSFGSFSGNTLPGSFTSTDGSGCLLLHFTSDAATHRGGWEADVQCSPTAVNSAGDFAGKFEAFPNPVDGQLQVRFDFPAREMAMVRLTDLTGRLIAEQQTEAVSGENLLHFECAALPSGTYFVTLKSAFGNAALRVVRQ